jgi:hypothetical protein
MYMGFRRRILFLQPNYNEVFTLSKAQILYKIASYCGTFCFN